MIARGASRRGAALRSSSSASSSPCFALVPLTTAARQHCRGRAFSLNDDHIGGRRNSSAFVVGAAAQHGGGSRRLFPRRFVDDFGWMPRRDDLDAFDIISELVDPNTVLSYPMGRRRGNDAWGAGVIPIAVNSSKDGGEMVVTAVLPGFAEGEVSLTAEAGNALRISATKNEEIEEEDDEELRGEEMIKKQGDAANAKEARGGRRGGRHRFFFESRSTIVPLPDDADVDNIAAAMEHGLLTITVPRVGAKADTRSIPITSGGRRHISTKNHGGGKETLGGAAAADGD